MPDTSSTEKTDEVWKSFPEFEEAYEVSNLGRVRSIDRTLPDGRFRRGQLIVAKTNGVYPIVTISWGGFRKTVLVHKAVAGAFIGPRPAGAEILHGDGDPTNCREDNLRYGTSKENKQDTLRHGKRLFGADHQNCEITDAQVIEIRMLGHGEVGPWADRHGVSRGHVYNIRSGNRR